MRDYYEVLGVSPDAGAAEIRRAYRRLARRGHPDISGDDLAAGSAEVGRAFAVLGDPSRRRLYDVQLAAITHGASDSLNDEVAIDFPSLTSVVDRMQHAFFGSATGSCWSAEVVVTPHEAFWGACVSLHVPVRRTCSQCGGRGEVWDEWCAACEGVGDRSSRHEVHLRVPAGVKDGARVRFTLAAPGAADTTVDAMVVVR